MIDSSSQHGCHTSAVTVPFRCAIFRRQFIRVSCWVTLGLVWTSCSRPAPPGRPQPNGLVFLVGADANPVVLKDQVPEQLAAEQTTTPLLSEAEQNWPWWRGPNRNNHTQTQALPTKWSEAQLPIRWQTALPGHGHASPIFLKSRLYLTTCEALPLQPGSPQQGKFQLLCVSADTGELLWQKQLLVGPLARIHEKNTHASATPATDGNLIFTTFLLEQTLWVIATDLDGAVRWYRSFAPFRQEHGFGASPLLFENLVLINGDRLTGEPAGYSTSQAAREPVRADQGFLVALERGTGATVWQTARPPASNYSTPTVAYLADRWQLLLHGGDRVCSYDPGTGELRWSCAGPTTTTGNTPVAGDNLVFATGGYPQMGIVAVQADGAGDVTKTHRRWSVQVPSESAYVPTPLYLDGKLCVVSDDGFATLYEGQTGKVLWKKRLQGNFSASPLLVGRQVYVVDEQDHLTVFEITPDFQYRLLGRNPFPGGALASPIAVADQLFLRSRDRLFCLVKQ